MIEFLIFLIGMIMGGLVVCSVKVAETDDEYNEAYHLGYQDGFHDAMNKLGDKHNGYLFPKEGKQS